MAVTIYYNNVDVFSGIAPTPFVGISDSPIRYQSRWGVTEKISLDGNITGKCQNFEEIIEKQNALISGLNIQFKELRIEEEGTTVFQAPIAKVTSINFPSNKYSQLIPFSIEFETFDSGKFSGFYGVLDPVNEYSFEKRGDKVIGLTHTISAKGFQTENDPITNASNYVSSLSGLAGAPTPLFISGIVSPVLKTIDESINRFEGTYRVVESWIYDKEFVGSGILRYTSDLDSGFEDGITKISTQGKIEGGKNCSMDDLRNRYSGINFHSMAGEIYSGFFTGILNTNPLDYSVDESINRNEIAFSNTYDDSPFPNPNAVDNVQLNNSTDSPGVVNVDVTFKWRGNCKCNNEYGWNQLLAAVNSYDFYSKAVVKWAAYGNTTNLNPNPISKSITENKFNCEINVKMGYDEMYDPIPFGIDFIDYNISVSPSLLQYSTNPSLCEGEYIITNLGYRRRSKYSISGRGRVKECGDKTSADFYVKNAINLIMAQIVLGTNIVIESDSITYLDGGSGLLFSFSFSWSSSLATDQEEKIIGEPSWSSTGSNLPSLSWQAVAFGHGVYIAVNNNGATEEDRIAISADGLTWTNATSVPAANLWKGICYGNGRWVVCPNGVGTLPPIIYSLDDGDTWTQFAGGGICNAVAYGNGVFVFVGNSGVVYRSTDGENIDTITSGNSVSWSSLAYGNGIFVAVSSAATGDKIMYSTDDGLTWTIPPAANYPAVSFIRSIAFGNGRFVTVSSSGSIACMVSTDGISWIAGNLLGTTWFDVAFQGSRFVATATASLLSYYSEDGISWFAGGQLPVLGNWRALTEGSPYAVALNQSAGGLSAISY